MITIEKDNMSFEVEVEGTKAYYQNRAPLTGLEIRNFEVQAETAAPRLKEYLGEFGVDIRKPDELCWCWKDENDILHYNVAYTVTGRIARALQYEMILQDKSALHIVLETEYVPNQQPGSYFAFTVYNIEMPWVLEEAYPKKEAAIKKEKTGGISNFVKKLKKYWTK